MFSLLPIVLLGAACLVISTADEPPPNSYSTGHRWTDAAEPGDARPTFVSAPSDPHPDSRPDVLGGAHQLASALSNMADVEMGVQQFKAMLVSSTVAADASTPTAKAGGLQQPEEEEDRTAAVRQLVSQIEHELLRYTGALRRVRDTTEALFWDHLHQPLNTARPCCSVEQHRLTYSGRFGCRVDSSDSCDVSPEPADPLAFNPGRNLTEAFRSNVRELSAARWQYFISKDGVRSEFPATRHHSAGNSSQCSAGYDTARHTQEYLSALYPSDLDAGRYVVLLVDVGAASSPQTTRVRSAAVRALNALPSHYHVSVLLAASTRVNGGDGAAEDSSTGRIFSAGGDGGGWRVVCPVLASDAVKLQLARYINNAPTSDGAVNVTDGLWSALRLLSDVWDTSTPSAQAQIVLLTDGLPYSPSRRPQPLAISLAAQLQRKSPAFVTVSAVITGPSSDAVERTLLNHLVQLSYSTPLLKHTRLGVILSINSTDQLSFFLPPLFSGFSPNRNHTPHFSGPHWDAASQAVMLSVLQPCYHLDYHIGMLGMDLHVEQLMEQLTPFSRTDGWYAFMIDRRGSVLVHPSVWDPSALGREDESDMDSSQGPRIHRTDVSDLERRPDFDSLIRPALLSTETGSKLLPATSSDPDDDTATSSDRVGGTQSGGTLYTWRRVRNSPYIVCVVYPRQRYNASSGGTTAVSVPHRPRVPVVPLLDLVYHRQIDSVDRLRSTSGKLKLCRHFHQVATFSSASLFLSASSFLSPSAGLPRLCWPAVHDFLAFLSDTTRLITNPGLRQDVRDDVTLLSRIAPLWRHRFLAAHTDHPRIVRAYAATSSGTMLVYPGVPMETRYEPVRRQWYQDAVSLSDRLVLSTPYLDLGGAGYIVTASRAVIVSPDVDFTAVVAVDLTWGYIQQLLLTVMNGACSSPPVHRSTPVTCLLLDHAGHVLYHPDLGRHLATSSTPTDGRPEQLHVSSVEPLLVNQLLKHTQFVRKRDCNSYTDGTEQRFYRFNLSTVGVVTNRHSFGEHCKQYRIAVVPGTNLLLAVLNRTCDNPAFCPCSREGRACLNCDAMETWECECPCECRLTLASGVPSSPSAAGGNSSSCPAAAASHSGSRLWRRTSCPPRPQWRYGPLPLDAWRTSGHQKDPCGRRPRGPVFSSASSAASSLTRSNSATAGSKLDRCIEIDCRARHNVSGCMGVLGCEWCVMEPGGVTRLHHPFCTDAVLCFNGVLRSASPYSLSSEDGVSDVWLASAADSAPVGAVAGAVLSCILVSTLAVLCYRHRAATGGRLLCRQAGSAPLTLEEEDMADGGDAAGAPVLLLPLVAPSPYRINAIYERRPRRPPPPPSSDQGYATMTPQDSAADARSLAAASAVSGRAASAAGDDAEEIVSSQLPKPHILLAHAQVHAV